MVRLITTLLLCAFVWITASASQITEQQALQVAAKYADIDIKSNPQRMKAAGMQQKAAAYYAFNIGDNEGFVIVSGDDSLTELVGYSDNGSFDYDNMPENMRSWLQAYSGYVASVQAGECSLSRRELENEATVVVQPLVTTTWNQGAPYNRMTPVENGQNCVTGCVATAMAQIMKYYEWPERGEGSYSYTDSHGHSLSADFSQSVYDWENMLDAYTVKYDLVTTPEYNDAQADAVAKLMLDCGISVNTHYSISGSGGYSQSVATALEKYFNYTTDLWYRNGFSSADFLNKLLTELDNKRPVLFAGNPQEGEGHAFVIDGYDSNNFFHVNWGWGSLYNGFFDVNYLAPYYDNNGYKYGQMFVVSYPNYEGNVPDKGQMQLYYYTAGNTAYGISMDVSQFQQNQQQTVSISSVYNPNGELYYGVIGVGAFDADGNMTMIHTSPQELILPSSGYTGFQFLISTDFGNLEEGEYEICGITRQISDGIDYEDWIKIISQCNIHIEVADGMVTVLSDNDLLLTKQIEKPEKIIIGNTVEFTTTIRNNSPRTVDGYVNYEVRRLSDNTVAYEGALREIVYDYSDRIIYFSVPIDKEAFEYSEEYAIAITGFTLLTGEIIPVESTFGQCAFFVDYHRLSFYDYEENGDCGISLVVDQFKKTDPQDMMFKYVYNPDGRFKFNGDVSAALCNSNGEIISYSPDYYTLSLSPCRNDKLKTMNDFTPDMGGLADGLYSIIPLSRADGNTEWVRFDHPSKVELEVKGDYVYVQNYKYCISQESDFTPSDNFIVGGKAAFNIMVRNNSEEYTFGDLWYEIRQQPEDRFVYNGVERVIIQAYSTENIMISSSYIFKEEGTYTISLLDYESATDSDYSYSTTYSPSAFSVGDSGINGINADRVTVYPNPVREYITVDCGEGISSVTIFSASGQLVKSIGGTDAEGSIHVGDLPAGYYIVSIETLSGATVRKQILKR